MANGEYSRDTSLLEKGVCWVIFRFPDTSMKIIRTTLRDDLLEGLQQQENCLFDLDKQRWFNLDRVAGSSIEIYTEMPVVEGVDLFANKYIV